MDPTFSNPSVQLIRLHRFRITPHRFGMKRDEILSKIYHRLSFTIEKLFPEKMINYLELFLSNIFERIPRMRKIDSENRVESQSCLKLCFLELLAMAMAVIYRLSRKVQKA